MNDTVVHVEHKSKDQVEEAQQGNRGCVERMFLPHDYHQDSRKNREQERSEAQSEVERDYTWHPAVGLAVGRKVRGHARRQLIPYLPVAQSGEWERQPHQRGQDGEVFAVHGFVPRAKEPFLYASRLKLHPFQSAPLNIAFGRRREERPSLHWSLTDFIPGRSTDPSTRS